MNNIKEKYRMFAPVLIPYAGQYSDTPVVRYEEVSSIKDIEFNRKSQFTAKAREKKLNKIVKIELNKSKVKPHFNFKYSKAPWSIVMQSKDLVIGYDKPLTRPLNLKMERNDKIAIIGANGIGKTTLLKSLMGIIKPISGLVTLDEHLDIVYYEQEAKLSNKAVLQEVWNEFPNMNKTEIRQILARCGLTIINHKNRHNYLKVYNNKIDIIILPNTGFSVKRRRV